MITGRAAGRCRLPGFQTEMNLDRRLLRLARRSRIALLLTIGSGFAAGVFTVIQAGLLSRLVDRVFLHGQGYPAAAGMLAGLAAAMAARAALMWLGDLAAAAISAQIKTRLRLDLYRRLLDLGPARLGGARTGELTHTLLESVEALDAYFSQYLPGLALAVVVPATILVVVFPLDPLTGLVFLLTAPLIPLFMVLIGGTARTLTRRQWETLSRMSAYFLDMLQGLTTLKLFGRSRSQAEGVARVGESFRRTTMAVLRVTFLSALVLEMVAMLSTAVVAVQVGLRLLYGRLDFEPAFFVLLLAPEFYLPLRLLGTRFHAGMAGAAAATQIFDVLNDASAGGAPEPNGGPRGESPSVLAADEDGAIRFDQVSFSYDGVHPALTDLSFEIRPGETVALVGPSGGGKSTLAAMLLGFVTPGRGEIRVGDRPLAELGRSVWHSRLSWLPQRPALFNDTVAENIRLGNPYASDEQVAAAARLADGDGFIQALPLGYATRVGEGGERLSVGQVQRVALARAFLRDAAIFILDEPGAGLDPESEARLQAAVERLLAGRTALVIAHRLSTVRHANRICVIDGGHLAAAGTHSELLEKSDLYRKMVGSFDADEAEVVAAGLDAVGDKELDPGAGWDDPGREQMFAGEAATRLGMTSLLPAGAPFVETLEDGEFKIEEETALNWVQTLRRLVGFLLPHWRWVLLSALTGAATVLSGVGLMGASAYIISAAALRPSIAELQVAIVGVRFFGIARGLFRYLERVISHETTFRLLAELRVWFFRAIEPLAPARLVHRRSGDLLARIQNDINSLESFYVRVAAPPLSALPVGAVVWLLIARFDHRLAAAWLGLWLAAGVALPAATLWLGRRASEDQVAARARLSAGITEAIQGLPELIVYDQAGARLRQIESFSRVFAAAVQRSAAVNGFQAAAGGLIANLSIWATVALAIPAVQAGALPGVYLAPLALIAFAGFDAVAPLPAAAQHLAGSIKSARRLFALTDASPAVVTPVDPEQASAIAAGTGDRAAAAGLSVRDLSFRYPLPGGSGAPVLDRVSFDLLPGTHVGLVGPSGSGKSTLVHLLLRFWEYDAGEIRLDGIDIRRLLPEAVREQMGVITQRAYLFNASVGDNLRLARHQAADEELIAAAKRARLHERILQLPQGYNTPIGERGRALSGGERQRLALAQALLKDAPMLILDEPTVGLDPITERAVLREIFELAAGRTLLLITHRLVEMDRLDRILVLDGGRIVETGAHLELLERGGLYRRMWDLQRETLRQG